MGRLVSLDRVIGEFLKNIKFMSHTLFHLATATYSYIISKNLECVPKSLCRTLSYTQNIDTEILRFNRIDPYSQITILPAA